MKKNNDVFVVLNVLVLILGFVVSCFWASGAYGAIYETKCNKLAIERSLCSETQKGTTITVFAVAAEGAIAKGTECAGEHRAETSCSATVVRDVLATGWERSLVCDPPEIVAGFCDFRLVGRRVANPTTHTEAANQALVRGIRSTVRDTELQKARANVPLPPPVTLDGTNGEAP